jgi:hypothetical protein
MAWVSSTTLVCENACGSLFTLDLEKSSASYFHGKCIVEQDCAYSVSALFFTGLHLVHACQGKLRKFLLGKYPIFLHRPRATLLDDDEGRAQSMCEHKGQIFFTLPSLIYSKDETYESPEFQELSDLCSVYCGLLACDSKANALFYCHDGRVKKIWCGNLNKPQQVLWDSNTTVYVRDLNGIWALNYSGFTTEPQVLAFIPGKFICITIFRSSVYASLGKSVSKITF